MSGQWPLPLDVGVPKVSPHGGYRQVRRDASDGACGYRGIYPCVHYGVDVVAPRGTDVVAPEDGMLVRFSDGKVAPFRGYGPGVVLLKGKSGRYHLLAHLDWRDLETRMAARGSLASPATKDKPIALLVRQGDVVGVVAKDHVHWEVRKAPTGAGDDNTEDPGAWLESQGHAAASASDITAAGDDRGMLWILALVGAALYFNRRGRR
jgi:murein DD-endopeptidase MepM/ murein hydrolase activator NlpD